MLLVVSKNNTREVEKIESDNFHNLKIWERRDIQEWIRQYPDILGERLLVVSMEFNRFKNSDDRLDILALDTKGNLVVVELKRDGLAGYADLQAVRYAAMVSSMTVEMLVPHYVTYQRNTLGVDDANSDAAREEIKEFITDNDSFEELSNRPRIILCSEDFSPELTTTVLWLNQTGLDISCVRIKPHKIGDKIVIVPSKIIPLQEAKQYLIEVQQKEEIKQQGKSRAKRPTTMRLLLENERLRAGDKIYLEKWLPDHLQSDRNNPVYTATVTGDLGKQNILRWEKDEQLYSISALTSIIFQDYHPTKKHPGPIQGGKHWCDMEGKVLSDMADEVWASLQSSQSEDVSMIE